MIGAHDALASGLINLLSPATARIMSSSEAPWASITFSGARHRYMMEVSGDKAIGAVRHMKRTIGTAEFEIRNQLVADVSIKTHAGDVSIKTHAGDPALMQIEVEAITVDAA